MFGGKTKTSALLNFFIIGVLSVGIWFYIQQQIIGERDVEFELQINVRPGPGVGDVVVLGRMINGSPDANIIKVKLRGSTAKLDEILRPGRNVALITLQPRREEFDNAPPGRPLTIETPLTAEHLHLPSDVEIISAPNVRIMLDEETRSTEDIPVTLRYTRAAREKISEFGESWQSPAEQKVAVTAPRYLLKQGLTAITEEIGVEQLPERGSPRTVTVRLLNNIREYDKTSLYRYRLTFDRPILSIKLEVAEKTKETELIIPVGVLAPDGQWTEKYHVVFGIGASKIKVKFRGPESKIKDLKPENVALYADFSDKKEPRTYSDVNLVLVLKTPLPEGVTYELPPSVSAEVKKK